MRDRQFYTIKLTSDYILTFDRELQFTFSTAKSAGKMIGLADSQMLRTIREVSGRVLTKQQEQVALKYNPALALEENERRKTQQLFKQYVDILFEEKQGLFKLPTSKENGNKIANIQKKIDDLLFVPEYVTVVMKNKKSYNTLYKEGFYIMFNGIRRFYKRMSCSAGQGRSQTVLFCSTDILDKTKELLNNGRDMKHKLAPSKFNAYFGLYSSTSKPVRTPKFCVVPDFENKLDVKVNYVHETGKDSDNTIKEEVLTDLPMNRTDGMGVISPRLAKLWAKDLNLDYLPAEFCIRQSFIKGMVCVFPVHEFCEKFDKHKAVDVWGNEINLDEVDLILTESQAKLWDSFKDQKYYEEQVEKNHLDWAVSLYTPKQDKDVLRMNYQFLQTLDLNEESVELLCEDFVSWISGISYKQVHSVLLFLLGVNHTEESITNYMQSSDNWWVKALVAEPQLINDKFVKKKINNLVKSKLKKGCLGQITIPGNFQVLVSDPYAMMEHVCGLPVKGLLGEKEFYSNYWNEKNINLVDTMRAPLTYRSEHVLMPLKKDKETEKWYRFLYTGLILNYYGEETIRLGGSDFDYDIGASTCQQQIIDGVYQEELPSYAPPKKPEKTTLTDKKLFNADKFSFGNEIGSITNKGSACFSLLSNITDPKLQKIVVDRLKSLPIYQNAQIDKTKIGKKVKSIPKVWVNGNKDNELDIVNEVLVDKHPYFFIYLYPVVKNQYAKHVKMYDNESFERLGISLDTLRNKTERTEEEKEVFDRFVKFSPVIESDSSMNLICYHIESLRQAILKEVRS